jgi:hypothetical protein
LIAATSDSGSRKQSATADPPAPRGADGPGLAALTLILGFEQFLGLLDQAMSFILVDQLVIEGRSLQDRDRPAGDFVPLLGEVDDLVLERRIGRITALERPRGDPRERLAAERAERRIDLLLGFCQLGQRLVLVAQRVGHGIFLEDFEHRLSCA